MKFVKKSNGGAVTKKVTKIGFTHYTEDSLRSLGTILPDPSESFALFEGSRASVRVSTGLLWSRPIYLNKWVK